MSHATLNPVTGKPFIQLTVTDSTNNYAMALAKNGEAQHGMSVFAHHQTAGKGQRGKVWKDAPGQNIALSVLLSAKGLLVSQQFRVSVAAALAAQRFISKYALGETKIKWPNDIYWRDRKAAGILIENLVHGSEWQWIITGIGININQKSFDGSLTNAVSLKQITGKDHDTLALAKELSGLVVQQFDQLNTANFKELLTLYNSLLYKRNEQVFLKKDSVIFNCTVKEVNEHGELMVDSAIARSFAFGEAEWRWK